MKTRKKLTRHHVVPKSRGGSDNSNNILMLGNKIHQSFHHIFDNLLPHEQIERLLEMNATSLTVYFQEKIAQVIDECQIYKRKSFK